MSVIIVDNISKKFRIPHEKKTTVFQNIVGMIKRQLDYEEFWALKDVSFEVKKGEALHNRQKRFRKEHASQNTGKCLIPEQRLD